MLLRCPDPDGATRRGHPAQLIRNQIGKTLATMTKRRQKHRRNRGHLCRNGLFYLERSLRGNEGGAICFGEVVNPLARSLYLGPTRSAAADVCCGVIRKSLSTISENDMLLRGYSIPSSLKVQASPFVFPGGGADDKECRSASGKARGAAHMHSAPASKHRTSCLFAACCSCGVILALVVL